MAELVIRTPGEPERVVLLLPRAMVFGRHDACDVQLLERKASKRHFEIAPAAVPGAAGAAFVVTDLQSSNGTLVEGVRVRRRVVTAGDLIRIGDTTLEVRAPSPAGEASAPAARPAVVLSPELSMPVAELTAAAPAPSGAPTTAEPAAPRDAAAVPAAPAENDPRVRREGARVIRGGALVLALGVAAVVLAQVIAGGEAERRRDAREEAEAYVHLLAERDRPAELFVQSADDFLARWPLSRRRGDVQRLIDAHRGLAGRSKAAEEELDAMARSAAQEDSYMIGRLLDLKAGVSDDPAFARRVEERLGEIARRRDDATTKDRLLAELDADRRLAQGDASGAVRRLQGFLASHPGRSDEQTEAVRVKQAAIAEAASRLADQAIARSAAAADPAAKRLALTDALRGLAETGVADRVRLALAKVTGGAVPTAAPTPAGTPPTAGTGPAPRVPTAPPPKAPTASEAQLAKAAEAERLAKERAFAAAKAAYEALGKEDAGERAKRDWAARAADLGRVQALLAEFTAAVAAAADHPLRIKLAGGLFDVLAADEKGVRLRRGEKDVTEPWTAVSPADFVALLAHGAPSPDKRLALGVAAAILEDRKLAVEQLAPLLDLDTHRALASDVVARRLDGRAAVPEGGYKALDGDIVDLAEFAKRSEAKRITALRAEAQSILEKAAADPIAKRMSSLRALRDELDRRRAYTLLAIFNEKHWPYPHPTSISGPYNAVWSEIQKRTKAVEEIWNSALTVKIPPTTGGGSALAARFEQILKDFEAKEIDVSEMRAAMAPHVLYAGETALTIRTFYRDPEEKALMAYNRWVVDVYNPARTAVIAEGEREEVRITNEYRDMMGYTVVIEPGPDPLEAIEGSTVVKILDRGRETSRTRLHLLRIDDRLVSSARSHSMDMDRRNYFDHTAPANAATQQGPTTPFDRMSLAGYRGGGASENIAKAGNALTAHQEWLYSSGHHRNILSDWADQGVGAAGSLWTQNFGVGGGADWTIPGKTGPTTEDK